MSQVAPATRRRRFRFSLAKLLAATTLVALLAAAWQIIFYRHPTYHLAFYEKAPSTRSGSIAVGPNRIKIEYLARNDRDGSLRYEDGFGNSLAKAASPNAQRLQNVGPWLDVVEIALAPNGELVDVMEFRAFNHETREMLFASAGDGYGWAMKAPNVVQLYGLKKPVPPRLDLWFRVQSYPSPLQTFKLPAVIGGECKLPYGSVRIKEIQPGFWSYSSRVLGGSKLLKCLELDDPAVTTVLEWNVPTLPVSDRYQITAVSSDGRRRHMKDSHYISFRRGYAPTEVFRFDLPIAELDHFALQPFGGRHRFFFEDVALPAISDAPFASSPVALIAVNGQEIERELPDFDPIRVGISTQRGANFGAANAGAYQAWVSRRAGGPIDVEKSFSVTYQVFGIKTPPRFRFFDTMTKQLIPAVQMPQRRHFGASSDSASAGGFHYGIPLDRIEAVEVSLEP